MLKILPGGDRESKTLLVNPTIPIPAEVVKIHNISDEDIKDKPTFKEIAKNIAKFLEGCDLAGYNSNKFDIPLLAEEFLRADVDLDMKKHLCVDVQVIFHKLEPRTLGAALKFYCKKELINAHSAEADTNATYDILLAQIEKYDQLKNDIETLSKFSAHTKNVDFAGRIVYNNENKEIFNFGKHKGKLVEEVLKKDTGYYSWMMNNEFPLYTKKVLTAIKLKNLQSNFKIVS